MAAAPSIDWIDLGTTYYNRNQDMQSVPCLARVRRHDVASAGWIGLDGVPIHGSSVLVCQETQATV